MRRSFFKQWIIIGFVSLLHIPFIGGAPLLPVLTVKAKKVKKIPFSEAETSSNALDSQQYTTLTENLENTPGVHVVQAGGVGKSAQLFVRGANPEHVLVLIDGLRAHDPSSPNGGFDFGQLETESLEKINVLRGAHSASYGSDAVGGVVQLTTKKGRGDSKVSFVTETGSFRSYRQSLSAQGEKSYGDFYLQAGHRQVDNPSSMPYSQRTLQRQYHPDPYDSQNFASQCSLKNQQGWDLSLHNRHQRSRSRYVNEFNPNPNSQDVSVYDLHGVTVERKDSNHIWQPKFQVGYLQSQRVNGQDQPPFSPRSFYKGQSLSLQWHNYLRFTEAHTLEIGVDQQQQSYQIALPKADGYQQTRARAYETSLFIGHHAIPHERVEVDLWGRGCHHRQFKSHGTYRAAVTYHHLETNTDLYTSYGTVIHNPSLFQIFDPESGNHGIRPEKGYGWEMGVRQALCQTVSIGTVFFRTRLRDLIVGQQLAPTLFQYNNINKSQTQGFESFVEWKILDAFTVSVNHLYTSAKNLSTQETLFNRPLHKLLFNLHWQASLDCEVVVGLSHDGKQANRSRSNFDQRVYIRGPILLRAALTYKPARPLFNYSKQEFFVRIENALSRRYEQPAGYINPGIGLYAGLRLSA